MEFKVVKRGLGKNRKYYFKGSDGKIYGEGYYEAYAFREGFAKVKKFFYKSSFYVSREEFEKTGTSHHYVDNEYSNGFARVKKDGKWYYVDKNFELHGEGYDEAWSFSEGFAKVRKGDKWYYVDKDFKLHGEGYDEAYFFSEGFADVEKDEQKYTINENFERIKRNNQIMEDVDYLQEAKDDVKSIVGIPAIRFSDDFVNKLKAIVLNHYEKEVEEAKSDKVEALRSEMEYIKKIIDEKKEQYSEKVADPNYQSLLKQAQLLFVKENFNDKEQAQKNDKEQEQK